MKRISLILLVLTLLSPSALKATQKKWEIHRGINISHWLSQNFKDVNKFPHGDISRYGDVTQETFKAIADAGFDHVRLPIDEIEMWGDNKSKHKISFDLLNSAILWCKKYNLKVIVDLHVIRSHHFNESTNPLWENTNNEQEWFLEMWRQLNDVLKKYPISMVAYEFMNEAVAPENQHYKWNDLISKVVKEIRPIAEGRKFFIGPNRWQGIDFLKDLKLPVDKDIIVSVHFYEPMLLSHYHASWMQGMDIDVPVHYPGELVSKEDIKKIPQDKMKHISYNMKSYDINYIKRRFDIAKQYSDSLGLQLYVGEFGCMYNTLPSDVRARWYRDFVSVMNQYEIPYTVWDLYGSFRVFNRDNTPYDKEILNILTSKE